jgi:hypothetical protein
MILLVAAVPLLKRALAARGRPEDLYRDLLGRLRDVLPPGKAALADSTALTPTEKLVLLSGAAGVEEGPPRELAHAYSESLYAARGPDERPARHGAARAYRRALYAYRKLPRWRRSLAAVNPSSLLLRARRWIAGRGARFGKRLRGRFRKRS